jgi:acyl carrier protein
METPMIDRFKDVLEEVLAAKGLPVADLTVDSNLFVDLGLDSLACIDFLVELDTRLGLDIDFESLEYEHLESLTSLERALIGSRAAGDA